MSDKAHKDVDNMIKKIEKELNAAYGGAYNTLKQKLELVHTRLMMTDDNAEIERLLMHDARIKSWISEIATEVLTVNKQAIQIINENLLDNYAVNYNYATYLIENTSGVATNITMFSRAALKELVKEKVTPFTLMAYDGLRDRKAVIRDLTREITQALILGESNPKLATRIKNIANKNFKQAMTVARTEMTRVESAGRQDAFKEGEKRGLKLKKRWVATYDGRTRDSHRRMNGEVVDLDKPFSNGLMYPAGSGKAKEVINCRCSHVVEFDGIKKGSKELELDEALKTMSYDKWSRQRDKLKSND